LWLAGLCDAFPGRFPTEILAEMSRLPVGMIDDMLEAKAYRQAKDMTDSADTADARKRLPKTPMFNLVKQIDMELAAEALEKARRG
jgi:hypothetical protein